VVLKREFPVNWENKNNQTGNKESQTNKQNKNTSQNAFFLYHTTANLGQTASAMSETPLFFNFFGPM